MKQCKIVIKKLILMIVLISILMMFLATPASNAKLDLEDGEFYYSGSTEGSYKPQGSNIFGWILKALGEIADFILGMLTLAPRMVFVGWTALIEKALTWAVESSAGVSADGSVVEDPTDLTAVTDSGNNITVEAIVYNKVAALNADIFDLEMDRTLSPTGHKLFCDKCTIYTDEYGIERYKGKYVDECCNQDLVKAIIEDPEPYKDKLFKQVTIEDVPGFCSCSCGGDESCYGCSMYFEQLTVEKPTIILIKENIATWYYIIRMLAMAIMLIVLIVVGIKMAISTIASDKAVYKRMLVDWVVGVIMLFTLHYFMVFVINLNAITVGMVEDTAKSVNQASLQQVAEDLNMNLEDELHSKDLEIRIYEEIRTRAYDAKLSNGMIGMVMYMALVFMAVKYTFIYLKRLLTIMVLTLMAPGVGVAYALQKVMTGKSQALKTWMSEYIMNVIIQTVHALIYAIFISQALILSLTNIAGMIVALVFLNYASKAEATFKKIFKFGGKDSLVGHTDSAASSMKESLGSAVNMAKGVAMGGKPAAKILTNTPYAKALKSVGKMAAAGAYKHLSNKYSESQRLLDEKDTRDYANAYNDTYEDVGKDNPNMDGEARNLATIHRLAEKGVVDPKFRKLAAGQLDGEEKEKVMAEYVKYKDAFEEKERKPKDEYEKAKKSREEIEKKLKNKDKTVTERDLRKAKEEEDKAKEQYDSARSFRTLTMPNKDTVALNNMRDLFSMENQFNAILPDGSINEENMSFSRRAFGTTTFDPIKMKYVNNNDAAHNILFSEKLFGLSDNDKKMLKEHVLPLAKGVIGMGALFVGMGTIVTDPGMGMGLLAAGIMQTGEATRKVRSVKKCKDRYTFNRFPPATIKKMDKTAREQARKERRQLTIQRLMTKRPNFIENFMNGNIEAATLGLGVGMVLSPALTAVHGYRAVKANFFPKPGKERAVKSTESVISRIKQEPGQSNIANTDTPNSKIYGLPDTTEEVKPGIFTRILSENAHYSALVSYAHGVRNGVEEEFTKESKTLIAEQLKAEQAHMFNKLDKDVEDQGYEFDPKELVLVRKETIEKSDIKVDFKPEGEAKGKPAEKVIDAKLDKILADFSGRANLDLSSKSVQREIIDKLESELKGAKLLSEDQTVSSVFRQGEAGLIKVIKGKAGKLQDKKDADEALRSAFSPEEIKTVNAAMKKQKKGASITEILAGISGELSAQQDGSQAVSTSDGTRKVDASKTGDVIAMFGGEKKATAIQAYVTANHSTPKTATSKKKVVVEMLDSVLTQYSSKDVEENVASGKTKPEDSEEVIKKLRRDLQGLSKANADEPAVVQVGTHEVIVDSETADTASNIVRNLLEMMELNKEVENLDIKNGTKSFAQNKKKKSELKIELGKLEIERLESRTKEQRKEIEGKIENKKNAQKYNENQKKMVGPIIDVQQVIGSIRHTESTVLTGDGSRTYPQNKDGNKNVGKTKKKRKAGGK